MRLLLGGAAQAVRRRPLKPGLRRGNKRARLCRHLCAPVARFLAATCGGRACHAGGCVREHDDRVDR